MRRVDLPGLGTAKAWREAARALVGAGVPPEEVIWTCGDTAPDLFASPAPGAQAAARPVTVPKAFPGLAGTVCWHSDPERFARLYAFLWRLRERPALIADRGDEGLARLRALEKSVNRDRHKMKAFLRFREIGAPDAPRRSFAAWFEPAHHIVEPLSDFFVRRFADMDWVIATPDLTARFEAGRLSFAEGQAKPAVPDDATEELWTTYFRNIFNPARLKVKAMQAEMPKKYWKNMPEAAAIPELIAGAGARAHAMQAAAPTLPPTRAARIKESLAAPAPDPAPRMPETLDELAPALAGCVRCPLHREAMQAVPGEGPADAKLMIVGEQPGDREDLAGRPFVGPAGQLFDRIAGEVGLDRSQVYVTNAVKHFKFAPRGKRRIHQRPDAGEVQACQWWLDIERRLVKPRLIVAMGATALASLTGTGAGILKRRGKFEATGDGTPVLITLHPSYLLRVPDAAARAAAERDFRADLARAAERLADFTA